MLISLKDLKNIRHNRIVRFFIKPFILLQRFIEKRCFSKSEDAQYIKTYKDKYKNKRCFIVGNGPSLKASDLDLIKGEISFGCNRIYNLYSITTWRPDFYMCTDPECLREEIDNIKKLKGSIKFIRSVAKKYGRKKVDDIHYMFTNGPFFLQLESLKQTSVSEDVSEYFSISPTVTCQEIEFAIYMGFREIYLIGVDHNYPISIDKNGKKKIDSTVISHFSGGGSKEASLHFIYIDGATESYQTCRDYADAHNIKIFNATRGGKLEVFERVNLEDVLKRGQI